MVWFHILWTTLLFGVFVGIVTWAWNGRQKTRFSEAERIPLEDDINPTNR